MDQNDFNVSALDRPVSWAAFLLLVASASGLAWYVPHDRHVMMQIFADFHLDLPPATRLACALPTPVVFGSCGALVLVAIIVQIVSRSKRSAAVFHLLLVVFLGVLFLGYREAMGSAFMTLVEGISSNHSPGG